MKSLFGTPLLVLDTETGGLNHLTSGIIEIGALATDGMWKITDSFEVKIRPDGFVVEPEAARVNGYSEEEWRYALSRRDAIISFQEWLSQYPSHLVVGYNIGFDVKFLEQDSFREGIDIGLLFRRRVDVMKAIDFTELKTKGRRRLSDCAQALGVVGTQAHRALADCNLLLDVMERYNTMFGIMVEDRSPGVADACGQTSMSYDSLVALGAIPKADPDDDLE